MSLANIRSGVKTKMETLTDVNNVLDYVVWTSDWQMLYDKFEKGGRVDTWMIGLNNTSKHEVSSQDKNITWNFNIVGYYSIKTSDESSKAFETIIETILNGFATSKNILGLPGVTNEEAPLLVSNNSTIHLTIPSHMAVISMAYNEITDQALDCGA